MPLNKKGKKIMKSMKEQYGSKKGQSVFYATMNKGKLKGVEKKKYGGSMNKKPYEKFKDTTKKEYENKKKRFPMMPKDEFDIRFENNPDFFEKGVSRAKYGGAVKKGALPPEKGPNSQGMKEGGDINARVEEELKKETPNAYPMMKGLSPITHLRRYLKKKELMSKKQSGDSFEKDLPRKQSGDSFGKVFKEARQKGEGTKFKYKKKDYSAVTKEDVSKSGKSSLKEYLGSSNKMKSGGMARGCGKVLSGKRKLTKYY